MALLSQVPARGVRCKSSRSAGSLGFVQVHLVLVPLQRHMSGSDRDESDQRDGDKLAPACEEEWRRCPPLV
jgi:hypothetical protein